MLNMIVLDENTGEIAHEVYNLHLIVWLADTVKGILQQYGTDARFAQQWLRNEVASPPVILYN